MSFISKVSVGDSPVAAVSTPSTPTVYASPVRHYRTVVNDSADPGYVNRLLVGTAVTGLVRIEWVQARYGQIIPANWSMVQMLQYLDSYLPLRYQVDDAQNLIVKEAIERDFEWLLLWEHDVMPPPDATIRLNQWIQRADTPIVSGLYYTRSHPSEPLVYRGRGVGAYTDWQFGDLVHCDGVPTGFLLIHMGILRSMWDESEEYTIAGQKTRRVFQTPRNVWFDPESGQYNTLSGTSDLAWCTRVIQGEYFRKSGWMAYADKQYPFVLDTNLFCRHINPNGEQFP